MGNGISGEEFSAEAMEAIPSTLAVNVGSATTQNVVNVSEIGELYSVSIAALDSPLATLTANLEIQIDAQTTQTLTLYTAGTVNPALVAFASFVNAGSDFHVFFPFKCRYGVSLRVGINISVAASGTLYLGVTRGRKY